MLVLVLIDIREVLPTWMNEGVFVSSLQNTRFYFQNPIACLFVGLCKQDFKIHQNPNTYTLLHSLSYFFRIPISHIYFSQYNNITITYFFTIYFLNPTILHLQPNIHKSQNHLFIFKNFSIRIFPTPPQSKTNIQIWNM